MKLQKGMKYETFYFISYFSGQHMCLDDTFGGAWAVLWWSPEKRQ